MSVIATICARGGSTGLPRKNIKCLLGKPLIVHTIEQALHCPLITKVYVSTDDQEIADIAATAGAMVPFLRPAHLATKDAAKIPVIEHLVAWVIKSGEKVSKVVDLDPTSPLRQIEDIQHCIHLLDNKTDCVITAYEAEKNPYFNMVEENSAGFCELAKKNKSEVFCRQNAPKVYAMNASIYVWWPHTLNKGLWGGNTKLYVMPRERSIDIDSELDFQLVELLMKSKQVKAHGCDV